MRTVNGKKQISKNVARKYPLQPPPPTIVKAAIFPPIAHLDRFQNQNNVSCVVGFEMFDERIEVRGRALAAAATTCIWLHI